MLTYFICIMRETEESRIILEIFNFRNERREFPFDEIEGKAGFGGRLGLWF